MLPRRVRVRRSESGKEMMLTVVNGAQVFVTSAVGFVVCFFFQARCLFACPVVSKISQLLMRDFGTHWRKVQAGEPENDVVKQRNNSRQDVNSKTYCFCSEISN